MATIGSFFTGRDRKPYIAAMQNNKTGMLYYYQSDALTPIPPSVYVWHTRRAGPCPCIARS